MKAHQRETVLFVVVILIAVTLILAITREASHRLVPRQPAGDHGKMQHPQRYSDTPQHGARAAASRGKREYWGVLRPPTTT